MNLFFKKVKESVKYWYLVLIIGISLIITGIWTLINPENSFLALSIIFSISFLFNGVLEILFSIMNRKEIENWNWTLFLGVINSVIGIMLLSNPAVSILSLSLYVGFAILFRSFWALGTSMDLKHYGLSEWKNLMIIGALGMVFSFILIGNPALAGMTLVLWTGMGFLFSGIFNTYLAFKMKSLHKNWNKVSAEVKLKLDEIEAAIKKELH
ncbi:hypothetical protein BWZ20_10935 [Winogradskyella sp. J14-2]|uniref:HdeD family acid-resistance protein n=1 Tax=Winogradskyella sp. J14-2 TaxID=1936080 RepID=UPI000972BB29|nr:DUF308 domain-containing protein [Winogradskyella sp. J14-2]APY08785.1 hypothetical protein BWZ20_10935 [Winogradskyella sp. J14-2]